MLRLQKIEHRDCFQILIKWASKDHHEVFEKLRSIPKLKYTKTHGGWYLPYNATSYDRLKRTGLVLKYKKINSDTFQEQKHKKDNIGQSNAVISGEVSSLNAANNKTSVVYNAAKFLIKFPYVSDTHKRVKKLYRSYWSKENQAWVAAATIDNLVELQQIFVLWSDAEFEQLEKLIGLQQFPSELIIYRVPEHPSLCAVKLTGYKIDVQYIKNVSKRLYERQFNRWLIPADRKIVIRLLTHYKNKGVKIINRLPGKTSQYYDWDKSLAEKQKRLLEKFDISQKGELQRYTDVMITQRYSWNTIKSYTSSLVRYIYFLGGFNLAESKASDVNRFLSHISSQKVSYSEVNKHCSAIKFYFEKVRYFPDFEIEKIKRPRTPTVLPKVLSKKQVSRMFGSLENMKHICMLYMLYNGGLRSGELIRLRTEDILWDRSQLFIHGGKGQKDRVVMLGEVMKGMLQEYYESYQPKYWLFEGMKENTPYSSRSLNQVVKKAAKLAGITQKVTTHTLRHCFATHLLESGTSIRLIQELLGHADIKTTLIYTHVSKTSIASVSSPLDALGMGKTSEKT